MNLLPTPDDEAVWTECLKRKPDLGFDTFLGVTGGAWRTVYCSPGCDCLDRRLRVGDWRRGLPEVRLRMELDRSGKTFRLNANRLKLASPRHREWRLLMAAVARLWRPPFVTTCERADGPVLAGIGLSAYDLWSHAAETAEMGAVARTWSARRAGAAGHLQRLAGKSRSRYANRLRRAGEYFQQEAEGPLARLASMGTSKPERTEQIDEARTLAEEASHLMADAVLHEMQVPPPLIEALLDPPEHSLDRLPHQETLYAARAGSPPLRMLAARRLRGSLRDESFSTLQQMLLDPEEPVRETALWSLLEMEPTWKYKTLRRALFSDVPETSEMGRLYLVYLGTEEAMEALEEHAQKQADAT